jgi:hypothetical protein
METETQTEPTEHTNNSSTPIELIIVQGSTSGLIKIDERTGSVTFPEDLTFEQWKEGLRAVRILRKKAAVAVADFISHGTKKWGPKKVDEALEQLEMEAILVKTAIAVNSIPSDMRLEHLDEGHYVELSKAAQLTKAKKIHWARIASEQRLTPAQLRFSIIEGEVVERDASKGMQTGVWTVQGIRQSFDVWYRRVGGLDGVKAMDLDHQMEIMEEIDAICEFGMQLHDHLEQLRSANAPGSNAA